MRGRRTTRARQIAVLGLGAGLMLGACATRSNPSPRSAEESESFESEEDYYDDDYDEVEQPELSESTGSASGATDEEDAEEASATAGDAPTEEEAPEPEFTEGMSVSEAMNAVPQGASRVNLEQDRLVEPIQAFKVYEPCNPSDAQHWDVRVAVWNGKAVGIDVEAKPKNPKFVECVKEQVRQIEWSDKVESLNTVGASF